VARLNEQAVEDFAQSAAPVFAEIDGLVDAYTQLWRGLAKLGVEQIAPLGSAIARDQLVPELHEVVGEADPVAYVVREPGLRVGDRVIQRARIEAVDN
jgi:hypothetical protein